MKIKYEFANETVEIEVEENWGAVLVELDRQEYNNDHAETRRHISLESSVEEGGNAWLPSDADVEHDVLQKAEFEQLYAAMQMLEPRQKKLIFSEDNYITDCNHQIIKMLKLEESKRQYLIVKLIIRSTVFGIIVFISSNL